MGQTNDFQLQLLSLGGAILDKPSKIDGFFFFHKALKQLQLTMKSALHFNSFF
jgi:hypothetical protein